MQLPLSDTKIADVFFVLGCNFLANIHLIHSFNPATGQARVKSGRSGVAETHSSATVDLALSC